MGFARWWMTHGPGSAGSVAKAMAKTYWHIKARYPKASLDDLLLMTLRTRYSEARLDNATAAEMVRASEGRLAALTLQVIHLENPYARGAMINAPHVYAEMLDIIEEVTAKYAPGA